MQVAGALVGGCGCTMGAQNCGRPAGAGRCRAPSRRDRRAFDKAARRRSELVASIGARLAAARLASLATCALQLCRGRSGWAARDRAYGATAPPDLALEQHVHLYKQHISGRSTCTPPARACSAVVHPLCTVTKWCPVVKVV